MGRAENVRVVQELFEALNAHDLDRAYGYYLPEASYLGQPQPANGLAEMRAVDAAFFEAFPDHRREIKEIVAEGAVVVVRLDVSGTNLGPRGGTPPTGRSVQFEVCNIITLSDSRVLSMRQIYDSAHIARQLG